MSSIFPRVSVRIFPIVLVNIFPTLVVNRIPIFQEDRNDYSSFF